MIVHARNITLENWSLYFETKNPNYLVRFIGRYFEDRLNEQFAMMFNAKDLKKHIDKQISLAYIYNKAFNLFPALHTILAINLRTGNKTKLIKYTDKFKEYFGREFKKLSDLDFIDSEAKRLQRKYASMKPQETQENESDYDLEDIIVSVELSQSMPINRKIKLFQFVAYWERAIKKSKKAKKADGK